MHYVIRTWIAAVMLVAAVVGAAHGGGRSTSLGVTIDGFRNARGHARVAVFSRDTGFPDIESAADRTVVAEISGGQVRVNFDGLPAGTYAVAMYHDENDDAKLNKGLFGIPKEGYAVSNNVVRTTRAPKYQEAVFQLVDGVNSVSLRVHY